MKKFDLEKIKLETNVPLKVSNEYRDTCKYGSLLGGYRVLGEALGDHLIHWHVVRRDKYFRSYGWYQEDIEDHIYLNMLDGLNSIRKEKIKILELGIGYAEPSLIFAGLLDNTNIFPNIKDYYILGVDADINHCNWSSRELKDQIKGKFDIVHAALSNYDGIIKFPQNGGNEEYGNYVNTGNDDVDCLRLQTLVDKFGIDFIDILHIDIQEQELNVISDSINLLGKINYMYIGTHTPKVHQDVVNIIQNTNLYDIIIDVPHISEKHIPDFGTYVTKDSYDGVLFCKLKKLI